MLESQESVSSNKYSYLLEAFFFFFNFSQIMPIISISFHIFLKDIQVQIAIYVPIYLHIWISMLNMRV